MKIPGINSIFIAVTFIVITTPMFAQTTDSLQATPLDTLAHLGHRTLLISDGSPALVQEGLKVHHYEDDKTVTYQPTKNRRFRSLPALSEDGANLHLGLDRFDLTTGKAINIDWTKTLLSSYLKKLSLEDRDAESQLFPYWRLHDAVWSANEEFVITFSGYQGPATPPATALDGRDLQLLAVHNKQGEVKRILSTYGQHYNLSDMQLSGPHLLTLGKKVVMYDVEKGRASYVLSENFSAYRTLEVQESTNLAIAYNLTGEMTAWQATSGEGLISWKAFDGALADVRLHPSLPLIIAQGQEGNIKIWRYEDEKITPVGHNLPEGKQVSLNTIDEAGRLWLNHYQWEGDRDQRRTVVYLLK